MDIQPKTPPDASKKTLIVILVVILVFVGGVVSVYFLTQNDPTTNTQNQVVSDAGCTLANLRPEQTVGELVSVSIVCPTSIDVSTLTGETFFILQGIQEKVPGVITLDTIDGIEGKGATMTLLDPILPNEDGLVTAVTVVVRQSGIKTVSGTLMSSDDSNSTWIIYVHNQASVDISQLVPPDNPELYFSLENLTTQNPEVMDWHSVAFKGEEALIGGSDRTLLKYDGESFTDISSLVRAPETGSVPRVDYIAANDEYWLIFVYGSNYEHLYTYDGINIAEITLPKFPSNRSHPLREAVWTGSLWLVSYDDYLWTFDGEEFTQLERLNESGESPNSVNMAWGGNKAAIVVRETNEHSTVYFYESGQLTKDSSFSGLITDVAFSNGIWLFSGTGWVDNKPVHAVYVLNGDELADYSNSFNVRMDTLGSSNVIINSGWWHGYWVIGMNDAVLRATPDFSKIERVTTQGGRSWEASDFIDEYGLLIGQNSISKLTEKQKTHYVSPIDWMNYRVWWEGDKQLYYFKSETEKSRLDLGLDMLDYHMSNSPYGLLFWKKYPEHSAVLESWDSEEITYEIGGDTAFKWYDFSTKRLSDLPILGLQEGNIEFERVTDVHFSNSEKKLLIEVGKYNAHAPAFVPGLLGGLPVITYGVVVNLSTNEYENTSDPITTYHSLTKSSTLALENILWDSKSNVIMGVPYGEGCGAFGMIQYVDLILKSFQKVDGTTDLTFKKGVCNPTHAISPDYQWVVLYGVYEGKMDFYAYSPISGAAPERYITDVDVALGDNEYAYPRISNWEQKEGVWSFMLDDGTKVSLSEMDVVGTGDFKEPPQVSLADTPYAFDECLEMSGYAGNEWYEKMVDGLNEYKVKPADITDACRSLDGSRLIMLAPSKDQCGGISIYTYWVDYGGTWVQRANWLGGGATCMKPATQFGGRIDSVIPLLGDACTRYDYHYLFNYFEIRQNSNECG